jgi:hypothetical protein
MVMCMPRLIFLAGVLPFASAFLGGILALSLAAPAFVEAQETRIRAESVVVVDDSGTNRAAMSTGPGARSAVRVRSQGGRDRVIMYTGGTIVGGGTQPDEANVSVFVPEADTIAALGTAPDGTGSVMYLRDRQGQTRIWLRVDLDGNPSIEMRDANGDVTWQAQ